MLALATFLLALSLLAAPTAGLGDPAPAAETKAPPDVYLVTVDENSTQVLWPYTSRRKSHDSATLPINVVVNNDAAFVRYLLSQSMGARWNVTEDTSTRVSRNATDTPGTPENATDSPTPRGTTAPVATESGNVTPVPDGTTTMRDRNESRRVESGVVINGTSIEWAEAHGSTRYTYVHDTDADQGRWLDERYQLHDGNYLGTRYHVRMYEGGSGDNRWTAIQVHREHWDWFRLRHTVDSVDRAQEHLEVEFRSSAFQLDISRAWLANDGPIDSDGWVTSVDVLARSYQPLALPGLGLVVAFASSALSGDVSVAQVRTALRGRLESPPANPRHLLLLASLSLLVVGVRVGAIALEQSTAGTPPKVIAAVFYPLLVLGTPACAVLFARGLEPGEAALTAALGFGVGLVADYAYLNIALLPLDVVLHRTVLITTVALFAAGGASAARSRPDDGGGYRNEFLVIAALQWVVALLIPLFDLL